MIESQRLFECHKPHVLLVSTNADYAGAPVHVLTLAKQLNNRVQYSAVFGEDGPIVRQLTKLEVPTYIIKKMRSKISPLNDFLSGIALLRQVKRIRPDLIHAHSTKAGMLARIVGYLTGTPVIFTIHGWGWRGFSKAKRAIIILIERSLSSLANCSFIFVSNSVKSEGSEVIGSVIDKGIVIHNGVDGLKAKDKRQTDLIRILMPARVCAAKDHETLIRAFEKLSVEFKLVFCGHGTDSDEFTKIAKLLAPKRFSDIDFLGERSDVAELMWGSEVLALISNFEALPLTVIEAMSTGLPVVATDVGGIKELIADKQSGILIEKGNDQQLSDALKTLADPHIRKTYAERARRDYENHFTSKKMAQRTFVAYLDVLKGS